ncbi:GNAT family N-acetyltransferase [Jiella mangrovi]|uniref:GNAT family N-acetyltransferase n=1 Tax=Jiella mangrovi TaxID=2821407 RepID=A0ABS4BBV9_9HYPH|nr:GNAT family N-acetyltransferase [Jiella mangrovi]MBP0614235.1 GNAT family N-acetyltransferase [Jiella mangrovi]
MTFEPANENGAASGAAPVRFALEGATTIFVNRHSGLMLSCIEPFANAESLDETSNAKRLFDRTRCDKRGHAFLRDYRPADLLDRQAVLVVAKDGGRTAGTAFGCPLGERDFKIGGLVVDPAYAGQKLATGLIAALVLHGQTVHGQFREIIAGIRRLPDDRLNEASRRSFDRLGFLLEVDIQKVELCGTYEDRHLMSSAEFADGRAPYVRRQWMVAEGSIAEAHSRAFLRQWTQAVLPLPLT